MQFTPEQFNELKHSCEIEYNKIGSVHCPYFNEKIHFNAKGWEHLIFKTWNRTRNIEDQYARLRHLHSAQFILQNSKTLQGVWRTQKIERIKRNKSWVKTLVKTTYYEFIAVVEYHASQVRMKIIVKQLEGGEKFFLSIIPYWGIDKHTGGRILHSGNPELD
jgi:hypothetical protein